MASSEHSESNNTGSSEANIKCRLVLKLVKIVNFVPLLNKLPHKTLKHI